MSVVRRFCQVDVFAEVPYAGNPVAVVLDAEGLSTEQMQRFAAWTNLSETAFVVPPTMATADYALRMFTPKHRTAFRGTPDAGDLPCLDLRDGHHQGPRRPGMQSRGNPHTAQR